MTSDEKIVPPKEQQPRSWRARRVLTEVVCVVLVAVAGGALAYQAALRPLGDQLDTRFRVVLAAFRASSMFALGHGLGDFQFGQSPALDAFYRGEVASVDPSSVAADIKTWPVYDSYSLMHYRLMHVLGWTWRLLGISTWSVNVLCAVFYASLMAVFYGLFRLAMGRVLSLFMVLFLSTSPAYLCSCQSLRDFSKAPFMLGFFMVAAMLLVRRQTGRSLFAWSVAAGAVAGVGYGFRQDMLACVPAALAAILVFSRVSGPHPFGRRLLGALGALAAFVIAGWAPISGTLRDDGSASAQALVQGVSEQAETRMDFGRASYAMHYGYADLFDFTVVNSFARRQGEHARMPGHFSAEHGRMGKRWFREVIREYPADLFSRGIASVLMLPKISRLGLDELMRLETPNQASIARFSPAHRVLAEHFAAWGVWYVIAGLVLFAFYDLRAAAGAGILVIYFAALPGLLFEFRHFFHLAFVPYWVAAAMAAWAGRLFRRVLRRQRPFFGSVPGWTLPGRVAGALLFPVAVTAGLALVLAGLWRVQAVALSPVLSKYEQAKLEAVPFREETGEKSILLCPEGGLPGLAATETLDLFESCGEYLVLDMDYDGLPTRIRTVYEGSFALDLGQVLAPHIDYPGHPCRVRLFFPVYQTVWPDGSGKSCAKFAGIEVEKNRRRMIHGLYRVVNGDAFALWPNMTVPEERGAFAGYKSGPHDRFPADLADCFHARFAGEPRVRINAEIGLAKRHPGYVPRWTDASSSEEETYERWKEAVRCVPELAPQAVADLGRFLPKCAGADTQSELQVQLHIADLTPEDVFAPTRAARLQTNLGDPAGGAERARAVLMRSPEYVFAARTLNSALAVMNAPDKRIEFWRGLHEAWPSAVLPAAHLAAALRDAGDVSGGLAILDSAAPKEDTNAEALLDLGWALAVFGRTEGGIAQIEKALGGSAGLSEPAASLCADAAEARRKAGDTPAALALFLKARDIFPKDSSYGTRAGDLLASEGDDRGALGEYLSALDAAPESACPADRVDALHKRLNDAAGRLQTWRKTAETHPEAAVPQLHLGMALEASGDAAGAESAYRRALSINPNVESESALFNRIKREMRGVQ